MTRYLLDIASYQGDLATADVVRADFTAVNLKISHGLTTKSVHPDLAGWVARAKAAELGISTFHYLDASATGAAQATYAYERLRMLGLTVGTAHQVDCESTATLAIIREYITTMQKLLGRPIAVYTGDWWWQPKGWDVSDLTPYLWAAPNVGYLGFYPGDGSFHWVAGYGGWANLSIMQYAVEPLEFEGGTGGTIKVSKSAIRDDAVWRALTGGQTDMTYAPASILTARTFIRAILTEIPVVSMGIVGDDNHTASGSSYHLGKSALRADSYTIVESARDRAGLSDAASALDFGWWSRTVAGKVHNLRTFSAWLVAQCIAGAPDTRDIREVIYSLDGSTVKRWDRLGIRTTGDASHTSHTHISWFRDSEGRDKTALFRRYFTEIRLIESEDDDMATITQDDFNARMDAWWNARMAPAAADNGPRTALRVAPWQQLVGGTNMSTHNVLFSEMRANLARVAVLADKILDNVVRDDGDLAAIKAEIDQRVTAAAGDIVAGLAAQGVPAEEIAGLLRAALGDKAGDVGRILAGAA